ncbi:MAG: hypothetical protein JWP84_3552, partial [Tardiphaga sp.]|nr:hypothetical protein [Tardiphaga sp.]
MSSVAVADLVGAIETSEIVDRRTAAQALA